MWTHNGWGGFEMLLAMVVFWSVIILLLGWVIRPSRVSPGGHQTAVEILEERFARGEIDEEELALRRAHLATSKK